MDFTLPPEIEKIRKQTREFIAGEVLPLEADRRNYDEHQNIKLDLLEKIRAKAKKAGLWAPQTPKEHGGMGLPVVGWAALYEEANRSIFGPVALNCAAPDDGNMSVLSKVATKEQQKKWLHPIVEGKVRSSFAMTEPAPGGGSDPSMIQTRAERKGNRKWSVTGHKWFITGAAIAEHFILIARTSADPKRGLTAFLFHKDQPGFKLGRRIPIMGPEEHGGHCEIHFDGMELEDENMLMSEGDGMKLCQIRLGPARLTHCMRWLGLSKRCLEIAQDYVNERESFGVRLADRESVQMMLADAAARIDTGRLLVMRAAWLLDKGERARKEISLAKIHVADTLNQAAAVAVQLQGARGYSQDTAAEWIYRYAPQARLVDGASEVHRMVLAGHLRGEGMDFWRWG